VITSTEDSQLHSVEDALLHKFEGRLPRAKITSEFQASQAQFRDARIRSYVPVLVQHDASARLRRLG
jgi:hypothetical protein